MQQGVYLSTLQIGDFFLQVMGDIARAGGSWTQQDPPTPPSHREKSFARTPALKRPRNKGSSSNEEELLKREVLQHVNEHFKQPKPPEDRFDVFGKNVAMKLRDLPRQQRVIAEKLINDALSEGEMNNLNMTHRITSFTQPTYTYPTTFSHMQQPINSPMNHSFSASPIIPGTPHSLSTSPDDTESVRSLFSNYSTNSDTLDGQ